MSERPDDFGGEGADGVHRADNPQATGPGGVDEFGADQAALVRETGNGATEDDELETLEALYGPPDADGVYGPRGGDA